MPGQIEVPVPGLEGDIQLASVFETLATNVSHVISTNEASGVTMRWEASGPWVPFLNFFNPEWRINVHMEGIGSLGDLDFGPAIVAWNSVPIGPGPSKTWTGTVNIPAAAVPAGAYKLVTTLQLYTSGGGAALPVYGFEDGPVVSYFSP